MDTEHAQSIRKLQWDESYLQRQNHVFYPHEEVIRFFSKYFRKRIGIHQFQDVRPGRERRIRLLDLGCGIGRHLVYGHEMGCEPYGVDLSDVAVNTARTWATQIGIPEADNRIVQSDARTLPFDDGFFDCAVSHGVLDSMPFQIARDVIKELSRVMAENSLVYIDLISGDDSRHAREFHGEEIVQTEHERDTVQTYFNREAIGRLIDGYFVPAECYLIRREEVDKGTYASRYHLALKKI